MALVIVSEPLPHDWLEPLRAEHEIQVGLDTGPMAGEVEGLLTMLTVQIDAALLDRFPRLKVVANMAVGFDNVDLEACRDRGVVVGNTPGVLTHATADLAFALLLASARRLEEASRDAREGRWGAWSPTGWLGAELRGSTLGIVGMGKIGHAVARRAAGFEMAVLYTSRSKHDEAEQELGARRRSLDDLLAQSDFVSLHVPLTEATRGMIGAPQLQRMKASAHLINTSRGPVVDQGALQQALSAGDISGAALDVTDPEPLPPTHPLYRTRGCLIAPHIGSATRDTRRRMARLSCANLLAGLADEDLPHPLL